MWGLENISAATPKGRFVFLVLVMAVATLVCLLEVVLFLNWIPLLAAAGGWAFVLLYGVIEGGLLHHGAGAVAALTLPSGSSTPSVNQHSNIEAMVARCHVELGGPDIVVSNAGIQHVARIEDFPPEKWDAIIAINLSSAFHGIRAAMPGMKKRKWGRIINIASAHGLVASAQKVAYVAAKHGIVGMTKVVGIEAANDGVTCNAICPGWVLTPLVQKQIDDRAKATGQSVREAGGALLSEKQPMHSFTKPESIGALAVFLCSDAAASITGSAYSIDGGWVAQ